MVHVPRYDELITFRYPHDDTTLMVFNLTVNVSEHDLLKLFQLYGLVHDIVIRSKTTTVQSPVSKATHSADKHVDTDHLAAHDVNIMGRSQSDSTRPSLAALMNEDIVNNNHNTTTAPTTPTKSAHGSTTPTTISTTRTSYFAFVKYYSVDECNRACAATQKRTVVDAVINVQRKSNMSKTNVRKYYPLKHHDSLQILNYFLGFNGHNIQIVRCEKYDAEKHAFYNIDIQQEQTVQHVTTYKSIYIAEIVVIFATEYCMFGNDSNKIHAIGISFCVGNESNSLAIKRAVTAAHNIVFADLGLVRLASGKTCVCSIKNKIAI